MQLDAAGFTEPLGQGWAQVAELLIAFALSSVIGLERQLRGKSAGLRTQAIVGTASALIMLVSKYGFTDVINGNSVVLDPSRVAAQIVSGIGFLGAGLIITRQGAIRGLTTAAAVWETAAIGMAAGAGLPILAVVVTALHFVIVTGYTWLVGHVPRAGRGTIQLRVTYTDRQGVLRAMLAECTRHHWSVVNLAVEDSFRGNGMRDLLGDGRPADQEVTVTLALSGPEIGDAASVLAGTAGVLGVQRADDENE